MPLTENLASYEDVQRVLDAAQIKGGAVYALKTRKEAVRWRLRAYAYRKLLIRAEQRRLGLPTFPVSTPYDTMFLSVEENKVRIVFNRDLGTLTDLVGNNLTPADRNIPVYTPPLASVEKMEELENQAKRLLETGIDPMDDPKGNVV